MQDCYSGIYVLTRPAGSVISHSTMCTDILSHLRSAVIRQLAVPRTKTAYGDRSLAINGPSVWNSILVGPILWGHSGPLCHIVVVVIVVVVVVVDIDAQAACDSGGVRQ